MLCEGPFSRKMQFIKAFSQSSRRVWGNEWGISQDGSWMGFKKLIIQRSHLSKVTSCTVRKEGGILPAHACAATGLKAVLFFGHRQKVAFASRRVLTQGHPLS